MESFITTISRLIAEKGLPALLIGGHAVTALGHARATFDVDLLIPRSAAEQWRNELVALRYRLFSESANFRQYESSPEFPLPPVDLMLVDDAVFSNLLETKNDATPIATPGIMAMIALKLHAISQPSREDVAKDWFDVIALIKAHNLSLDDPDFSATVRRHGGEAAIQRIGNSLAGGN